MQCTRSWQSIIILCLHDGTTDPLMLRVRHWRPANNQSMMNKSIKTFFLHHIKSLLHLPQLIEVSACY